VENSVEWNIDAWCNYGWRLLESMDPKSPEYLATLYRLRQLTRARVSNLVIVPLYKAS
jgi:hypothetical protein